MSWSSLHAQSEQYAIEAALKLREQNRNEARALYDKAADAEEQALQYLEKSKVRTRGITAVSAVALWFKAAQYQRAEQLAYKLLADSDIPEFACENIKTLVQAIWTEGAKQKAGVTFIPGQVLVSVKDGETVPGGAPLDLIVQKVQTIQSMFFRTVEYLNGVIHRKAGSPARELQEACRPWLFQSIPGSYQFAVAIQKPRQSDFFKEDIEPDQLATHFLEIVRASSGEDERELEALIEDATYRKTFLQLTRNLAPNLQSFERVELRADGEVHSVCLDSNTRNYINNRLHKKIEPDREIVPTEETVHGILRAVHLDKDWLDVVVNGDPLHVEGLKDTVDDVIGPMVNRSVAVRILRQGTEKPKFVDIELSD